MKVFFCILHCIIWWLIFEAIHEQQHCYFLFILYSFNYFFDIFYFQVKHVYGITIFENSIYLAIHYLGSIAKFDRFNHSYIPEIIKENLDDPTSIHVYHRQRQPDLKGKIPWNFIILIINTTATITTTTNYWRIPIFNFFLT